MGTLPERCGAAFCFEFFRKSPRRERQGHSRGGGQRRGPFHPDRRQGRLVARFGHHREQVREHLHAVGLPTAAAGRTGGWLLCVRGTAGGWRQPARLQAETAQGGVGPLLLHRRVRPAGAQRTRDEALASGGSRGPEGDHRLAEAEPRGGGHDARRPGVRQHGAVPRVQGVVAEHGGDLLPVHRQP